MKKTILLCIIFALVLSLFAGCSVAATKSAEDSQTEFKYAVVQEADDYYLHKLDTWSTKDGIVIFKCPVCGTVIRVPEMKVAMYTKVSLDSAWSDYVNVCSGEPDDWQDLLYN